jgi:hypothetical protein
MQKRECLTALRLCVVLASYFSAGVLSFAIASEA